MEIPKKKGDKAYLKFITACAFKNWIILEPIGDCDRYDCVIDKGSGLEKVQVKTGKYNEKLDSITFPVCSSNHYVREGKVIHSKKQNYKGQVDYFGVYCFELDKSYLVPIEDIDGSYQCNLRVLPPKNNQVKKIKWAKDYEI